MSLSVVMEPNVDEHDPQLYAPTGTAHGVHGYAAADADAVQRYRDDGFLIVHGAFSANEVTAAKAELKTMAGAEDPRCDQLYFEGSLREAIGQVELHEPMSAAEKERVNGHALGDIDDRLPQVDPEVRSRHVRKVMGFVQHHPPLRALADKPQMLELITRIVEQPIELFQDMALIKPPGGREKPWHQDHAYFNLPLDARVVGVWIALDEATPANGCMTVLAGGHRDGPRLHFRRRDWQLCDTDMLHEPHTALPMQPGDALLFDGKLPHGTAKNRTDQWRWAVQFHYRAVAVQETSKEDRMAAFGSEGKDVTC